MYDSLTDVGQAIILAHNEYEIQNCEQQPRKSRWSQDDRLMGFGKGKRLGQENDRPYKPPPFVDLPVGLSDREIDQFLREQRLEELHRKMVMNEIEDADPDIRPPSPPPTYDRLGNRTNTRDVRVRKAMVAEYNRLIRYMIKNVEGYLPPADWRPQKLIKKIIIPNEKYPDAGFLGIIIGPRGINHKEMQEKSGCRIVIRGMGITDKWQTDEEAAMPQHVHIEGDTEEQIQKAEDIINPLLDPNSSDFQAQKQRGFEQVALINGFSANLVPADLQPNNAIQSYELLDARVQNQVMERDRYLLNQLLENNKDASLRNMDMNKSYNEFMRDSPN